MTSSATDTQTIGIGKLVVGMAAFVALGIPLVAYIWETINRLLAGHFEARRVLMTLPAIILLAIVFVMLTRMLNRWQGEHR